MQMKTVFRPLLALGAAMLISVCVSAKEKYPKARAKADNRVENMCQTVKLSNDIKEKIKQITYDYIVLVDVKYREQEWPSQQARKEAGGKAFNEYIKQMRSLIPSDQRAAFETWRRLPPAERDRQVAPSGPAQKANADPKLTEKEQKARDRANNRVENMCQTVKINDDLKQIAKDISYDYFYKVNIEFRAKEWASEEEKKAATSEAYRTYTTQLKKLIPEDQMEAYRAWSRLSTAERDRKVDPAPSIPAQKNEKAAARAEKRVANLCRAIQVNNKTKQLLEEINYNYFYEADYLNRFRTWKSEEERKAASGARYKAYLKEMESVIPADQMKAFKEWCKLPTAERDK